MCLLLLLLLFLSAVVLAGWSAQRTLGALYERIYDTIRGGGAARG